ncbi:MAG: EFR1 family ferrodoxin [Bacteroidales bacterium]|nr:EFR1 family ferrodoxin [Bacteroidales bacterium]
MVCLLFARKEKNQNLFSEKDYLMNNESLKFNKLIIFYFSGTGNAKKSSERIIENAEEKGIETELVNISNKTRIDKNTLFSKDTLLGFCYPTHGFNAPPLILKFLSSFPKGKSDIFVLNTRAGMKLYKLFLPGIGGLALWLPALMLFFKGYKPIGFRPVDMPSNWISLHPGLRKKVVDSIHKRWKRILGKFSNKILSGKKVFNGFFWLPIDIVLIPITILYYCIGRFFLAKTFYANYNCNMCGKCIRECSVGAIKKVSGRPYWKFSCESCMKCMNNCPQRAIETAHAFTFLLWWFIFSVLPFFITINLKNVKFFEPLFEIIHFRGVFDISSVLFGFISVFLAYHLLHYLLRFKFFNYIITKTSLTHYKFWRRYKAE